MNIMLKLINIKRTDEFIEAYYIPEDTNERGYVKIDMRTDAVVEHQLTKSDSVVADYFAMARGKLMRIKNDKDLPSSLCVMWY